MNNDYHGMETPSGMWYSDYEAKHTPGRSMHDGVQMSRMQSGASNESWVTEDSVTSSFSNDRIPSPEPGAYSMVEVNKSDQLNLNPYGPQQQYNSSSGGFQQNDNVRPTPSSLGWAKGTEIIKLYTFMMPKGQSPYLRLQDKWTPTYETPAKVYLDEAK
jgi:hypothetical protein